MPRKELLTPAGLDHDYNFISSIERGIQRSDRLIVQEKGLVTTKELFHADRIERGQSRPQHGHDYLSRAIQDSGVRVRRAPKGMKRQKDNGTKWHKAEKCLNWQVEWHRENDSRELSMALENISIGKAYGLLVDEERRAKLSPAERKRDNKRKVTEDMEERNKRARLDYAPASLARGTAFQNPESGAWNLVYPCSSQPHLEAKVVESTTRVDTFNVPKSSYDTWVPSSGCFFYLHRPGTNSSYPRVVTPLHPDWCLKDILRDRLVHEFPTIFAISSPPRSLARNFMLENVYLALHNRAPSEAKSDSDDDNGNDTGSSSTSDSESETEDGEVSE
jgi:hypothetical protein